ncbi:MAG: hypothetical protein U0838_09075 [Chloroflexota bacterium]
MVLGIAGLVAACGGSPKTEPSPAARADAGPLSFAVPAGWTLTPVGHQKHYSTVLAFLTSPGASASESCGPAYVPGMGSGCADTYTTPAAFAVIRLEEWQLPARAPDGAVAEITAEIADGAQATTVAGQPAAYHAAYADVDAPTGGATVAWWVAGPADHDGRAFAIVATTGGQDPGTMASVQAIVDSLQIAASDPPAP